MPLHRNIEPGMAIDIGDDIVIFVRRGRKHHQISVDVPKGLKIFARKMTNKERKRLRHRKGLTRFKRS